MRLNKVLERQSNIELFRIFAIFCILLEHAVGWFLVRHGITSLQTGGYAMAISRSFILAATCIGVDCFILISGYFGIKLKGRSILNLFLILFAFYVGEYLVQAFCIDHHFSWHQLMTECMALSRDNWFVQCYLFLMILSPVLNAFVDKISSRSLLHYIGLLAFCACYFGCVKQSTYFYFNHGYSITNFVLVYLIGRYLNVAGIKQLQNVPTYVFLCAWVVLTLFGTLGRLLNPVEEIPLLDDYCSPIQLFSTVLLFIPFTRMKLQNKVVNYMAGSGLAVFVFHATGPVVQWWSSWEANLFVANGGGRFLTLTVAMCLAVFVIATLLDKIRAWLAQPILRMYDKLEMKIREKYE